MTNFDGKKYVASDADIRQLATESLQARSTLDKTRSTYLRVLIGTAQEEIRKAAAPAGDQQLSIARQVHRRFFRVIEETVMTKDIKPADRAHERQRRTGFARSASSTVNGWLKVEGHDLLTIQAAKASKMQMAREAAPRNPHMPTEERTMAKVHRYVEGLMAAVRPFAQLDDNAGRARELLEEAVQTLTAELRKIKPAMAVSTLTQTRIERANAKRALTKKAA